MASYVNEVDSVNGGGFGGGMGGGWGLIIFFLFLFAIFSGKRGLFGGGGDDYQHKCGPSNCELDRDIIDGKYQNEKNTTANADRIIANENNHYNNEQAEKLNDSKMENYFLKGQLGDIANLAPIKAELSYIMNHMAIKRPEYACTELVAVDKCGQHQYC